MMMDFGQTVEQVALLAEGVDRNRNQNVTQETLVVALLAEGVDRNSHASEPIVSVLVSPSSRRAWIEMMSASSCLMAARVALLAEGVDRNRHKGSFLTG